MKKLHWSSVKNNLLNKNTARGQINFNDCKQAIREGRVLDDIPNPSSKYPHQRLLILDINDYAYVVPYVETAKEIYLKTVFPSRKHTATYLAK